MFWFIAPLSVVVVAVSTTRALPARQPAGGGIDSLANILAKAQNSNPNYRFPATWGPNFDWLPDQCHGGNLMHTLQLMLIQADGDKILLFPACRRSGASTSASTPRTTRSSRPSTATARSSRSP